MDEMKWFLLFLLIMKMLLLWMVAAWVVAVTAERPCAEYCVYLSSGTRDIEFQPRCDCVSIHQFQDQLDDSGISYEPADYFPLSAYIHNQPFYILNPVRGRQTYFTGKNIAIPEVVQPSFISPTYNTEIELNIDNTHSIHNRKEKDIQTNNQRSRAPLYLDINIKSGDIERSATTNTFTAEKLKLTEQSLLECADLYAVLHPKRGLNANKIDHTKLIQSNEYPYFSNTDLRNKCLHITYIIEKSLDEIKKTRSKSTSFAVKIDGEDQQGYEAPRSNVIQNTNKHTLCTNSGGKKIQSSIENEDSETKIKEYDENQVKTTIIYTDSDEYTFDGYNTLSSDASTSTAAPTSTGNIQSSSDSYTKTEDVSTRINRKSIEHDPNVTPIYTSTDNSHQEETITQYPETMTSRTSTSPTIIVSTTNAEKQEFSEKRGIDQEFIATNVQEHSENRSYYEEGEVPLPKIITQEFSNNTVQSSINGTEDIPNGDFKDERKYTEVNIGTEYSRKSLPYYQYTESPPAEFETSTYNTESQRITSSDISGTLYFIFNEHQIPAKFVQKTNGSLHLGIDGVTLCEKLIQNGDHSSVLLTTLCNSYKSGKCPQN